MESMVVFIPQPPYQITSLPSTRNGSCKPIVGASEPEGVAKLQLCNFANQQASRTTRRTRSAKSCYQSKRSKRKTARLRPGSRNWVTPSWVRQVAFSSSPPCRKSSAQSDHCRFLFFSFFFFPIRDNTDIRFVQHDKTVASLRNTGWESVSIHQHHRTNICPRSEKEVDLPS